ncbi:chemotaxis-related protein WspD [Pseudomonas citronellolis]|uniref:Chemotaxis protein CheW n=1 Tax=Pseudomonas citronellolis TaxID=53408 RepID=A0AAQ1KPP0_9PSED|nr:chemotaxis protein CheW [Pseudomonas citronellolis]TGC24378.1 chemotaxis protein CheW [Pseudomonas citronellolis]SFE02887.1 chemotaxis-related protein WspD [Pseudomonas citronellolis]
MSEQRYHLHPEAAEQAVDDCWNRIGIRGDKSCPQLAEHIHCRNCPVHAAAAVRLLDRYALGAEGEQSASVEDQAPPGDAYLLFRLGEEWLALRTLALAEVAPNCPVHSLPHQRSPVVLGVANVHGTLVACLSLAELLGLPPSAPREDEGRRLPRMLVLATDSGPVLAPVDEVDGIHPLAPGQARVAAAAGSRFTHDVLKWRERSVRLLDHQALLAAAARSLA